MKKTANTVLEFPKSRIVRENVDHLSGNKKSIDDTRRNILSQLVDHEANRLIVELSLEGIDIEKDGFDKYFALSMECLRASVFKTFDISHPLQSAMDEMIAAIEAINKSTEKNEE